MNDSFFFLLSQHMANQYRTDTYNLINLSQINLLKEKKNTSKLYFFKGI